MNEFLTKVPFDLYELSLFRLVAELGSFTKAGQKAGLGQSAITRQIRGMEEQLGVALFERTTRQVNLTSAGRLLYEKSTPILAATEATLKQLREEFHLVPQTLRIGVARSIGLAYYPGFFSRSASGSQPFSCKWCSSRAERFWKRSRPGHWMPACFLRPDVCPVRSRSLTGSLMSSRWSCPLI